MERGIEGIVSVVHGVRCDFLTGIEVVDDVCQACGREMEGVEVVSEE